MEVLDFVATIDLGSSKVRGALGKKNSDGSIQIYAYASEDSASFMKKGVIFNLDKTAQCITSIINQLEGAMDNTRITKVYVGISGKSLRSIKNIVVKDLGEERKINQELLDSIAEDNKVPYIDMDILDVYPQEYKVGNSLLSEPIGIMGSKIEGRFLNIVAKSKLKRNISKCFSQAKTDIADFFISPIVLADEILSETEKRSGCALVDFGCETTTVSVYKNNILRFLAVLPLGGNNITKDISTVLRIEEDEAERLKCEYGIRTVTVENKHSHETEEELISLSDGRKIKVSELSEIIEARAKEIIANVFELVKQSQYDDKLGSGFIITGGAANLYGLESLIESFYHSGKRVCDRDLKIRKAKFQWNLLQSPYADMIRKDGSDNVIMSMLCTGRENCGKHIEQETTETPLTDLLNGNKEETEKEKAEEKKEDKDKDKDNGSDKKKRRVPKIFGSFFDTLMNEDK